MPEIGILVTGKNAAAGTLRSVRRAADGLKDAFGKLGGAVTVFNQGLELGRKAMELFRVAFVDQIDAALRFRRANDPILKWFKEMQRESELLRARLGDALLPVVQGLAEGFGLVGDGASEWAKQNRRLIATGVLNWVIDIGNALTTGVAKGTILVVKAWNGWLGVISVVEAAANKFWEFMSRGIAAAIDGMRALAEVTGQDSLARSLGLASDAVGEMASDFESGADTAISAISDINAEMEAQIALIEKAEGFVRAKLVAGYEQGMKRIASSTAGANSTIEEQIALISELDMVASNSNARRIAMIEKRAAFEDSIMIALAQKEDERLTALADRQAEVFGVASDAISGAISGLFQDSERAARLVEDAQNDVAEAAEDAASGVAGAQEKMAAAQEQLAAAQDAQAQAGVNAAKTVASAVIDAALAEISAHAVTAAAGAFSSQAAIPIVGPALGAAASIAVGAAVAGLGAGLKGAIAGLADGGVITGGVPGRDSVPAMLMPGEQVASLPERAALQKFMTRLLGAQAGQRAGSLSSGQPPQGGGQVAAQQPVVVQTINRTWVPNRVEEMQMTRRQQRRSVRLLAQQGSVF